MKNILLTISYDGHDFFGWQKTKEGPSIEEALEKAFFLRFHTLPRFQAASRTDRGVHAKEQKVNFFSSFPFPMNKLPEELNAILPSSIAIHSAKEVNLSFHPSLGAKKKRYLYQISLGSFQTAFQRHYAWHYPLPLDIPSMQQAADVFCGRHNFSSFSSHPKGNPICTLFSLDLVSYSTTHLTIALEADRFLYHMARTLVGTLVWIGSGKLERKNIPLLLSSRDRKLVGPTAPAHGLFLEKITFEK